MKAFLRVSKSWYLDKATLEFVRRGTLPNVCNIDIPFWDWTYAGRASVHVETKSTGKCRDLRLSCAIPLRNFIIEFSVFDIHKVGSGLDYAHIYGSAHGKEFNLSLAYITSQGVDGCPYAVDFNFRNNITDSGGDYGHYYYSITDDFKRVEGLTSPANKAIPFACSPFYIRKKAPASGQAEVDMFSYGLSKNQQTIIYHGRELGKSLIFMFGTWAVLLNDDLSFDAVAVIRSCGGSQIIIDKFLFTVNPYIVKVITLL